MWDSKVNRLTNFGSHYYLYQITNFIIKIGKQQISIIHVV